MARHNRCNRNRPVRSTRSQRPPPSYSCHNCAAAGFAGGCGETTPLQNAETQRVLPARGERPPAYMAVLPSAPSAPPPYSYY